MSTIEKIPELLFHQNSLTLEQQKQTASYQLKIRNASQKINPYSQPTKNLQYIEVKEIGIQEDIEVLHQVVENLQIDNAENCQEMETMDANLGFSMDFKIENEFLKSAQKTNKTMSLAIDRISKFG